MTQFNGKSVLLLGSGGLRIGQAGEFDYSGSQAIKALKEANIRVILINPNIATVQTDASMADTVYLQPLNLQTVSQIIEQEQPDGILISFGGQTALNLGLRLADAGILAKYQVTLLGSSIETVRKAEDRALFKAELDKIQVKTAHSICVTTVSDALAAAQSIGFPVMLRSGFSLGGQGSGIIHSEIQLKKQATEALTGVSQILIEECLLGWTEFEYEIVRDSLGNTITVCNMENLDPMGIHTGESIVVAPSQTLNNYEYHFLREIALQVANQFTIIGECNIQYAFNRETGDYRVIEINPRLSRSSALASKATGYPLAFVATKLALGLCLHEIKNSVTGKTCAFFEPALDYIVVKIPKWDTHKLKSADRHIGTEMKSVGEVMAIGRSFAEALQKAIGMLDEGCSDLAFYPFTIPDRILEIRQATDRRIFALYQFFKNNGSMAEANQLSQINPWFLNHIRLIAELHNTLENNPLTPELLRQAKQFGFSDATLATIYQLEDSAIRALRLAHRIVPYVKQIDTLAGEFKAQTNYLYLTYHANSHDLAPSQPAPIIILGSGPYRIGSSVEFDWCAVNTARTLTALGESPIIINSNPETVSTDYDESSRLYFEQLSLERIRDIADFENPKGINVSVGGQIANNLALALHKHGYSILGTHPEDIDRAENRTLFSSLLNTLHIDQPAWETATHMQAVNAFIAKVGFPVLIRPSYVLSGAAMNVVYDQQQLQMYLKDASKISLQYPVVISQFIQNARELEIDGVAKNGDIVVKAISEHIENAGVHSGDATIVLPPQKLYLETVRRTTQITREIIKALKITGPFNIQFIAKNNTIKVIECNVRASRSLPFVSKVTNYNFIEIATKAMLNKPVPTQYETIDLDYVGVKTPQFSYNRLKGSNPVAHVEMASTGEVACLGEDLLEAFFLSWQATELAIPNKRLFVSIGGHKKIKVLEWLKALEKLDWELYTTEGTHDYLSSRGVGSICVFKVSDKREPNISTVIIERKIDLIINIPSGIHAKQQTDGFILRRLAIDHHIPLITNIETAQLMLQCLVKLRDRKRRVRSWQDFMKGHQRPAALNFLVGRGDNGGKNA